LADVNQLGGSGADAVRTQKTAILAVEDTRARAFRPSVMLVRYVPHFLKLDLELVRRAAFSKRWQGLPKPCHEGR